MCEQISDLISDIECAKLANLSKINKVGGVDVVTTVIDGIHSAVTNRKTGNYYAVDNISGIKGDKLSCVITKILGKYISNNSRMLVVGFGNVNYMCDRLGSGVTERLNVGKTGKGGELAAIAPLVKSVTGIDSSSVVKAVAGEYRPDIVIAVDTLATSDVNKLANSLQITDAGINPGGGIANPQGHIDAKTLGVKIVALGVPLVINVRRLGSSGSDVIDYVVPKDIDDIVDKYARIIADGINRALSDI